LWILGIDGLLHPDDISFAQAQGAESAGIQLWQDTLVDPVPIKVGGIPGAIIHVAPRVQEEFEPVEGDTL
jgi:hypothetical protein